MIESKIENLDKGSYMKRVVLLSMITSSIMYATNGDNLIALGPESRAMGGTGIAYGMGADSVFKNPAWLVYQRQS